ncbi:hypothetical protein R69927_04020 [Paraburkholderia domus]|jgi:hypothetical protein|uniref:Competence protein CoiA-like family protein n=1 Tax=Paraburkholderia domus TaxID=2793075 RepID=A0A9N8MR47_9BURK|nr:hypothetical protein [Paraburkholderia domus]MBK5051353.1 hypothetical protein [Burkholderia sp. R-70006]MBK5061659.1 hypothetical protein [Burkholderia sp. R-70199]MBK5088266.1 hypothetical protein [Burkholderia sp. R-69927]MBK5123843.1 hypothetical protein [Burkholderia sp. R-69980]MBK5165469.1 hypothetical protein [Burkholderia sp. R-70211]MBK5186348.1 hypothetical protein [Burkholderia sp. R-69749]MCI0148411.1 hypothetical protein [Paraburkholderia sediminicola]
MPKAARIVFARDSAANVAAASDVFASHRSAYFCVACGKELQRTAPENGFPYFRHAHRATCRLSAHYALRAAAQHILLESRFIKAPLVGGEPGAGRVPSFLIQWTDSIADIKVVHVPVDFVAETADGQLIVEIAIPGLPLTVPLDRVEKLEVPTLIVSLPEPARIHGWADLRQYVLHSIENKSWLVPFEKAQRRSASLPAGEWHAPSIPGAADKASSAWTSPLVFADNAFYLQLSRAQQLAVLQKQMALPCDQWPAEVDIEVCGEDAFGMDRRGWQADVFSRFILSANTDAAVREVAFSDVLRYLSERYWVEADQKNAARMALFYYLQGLAERRALLPFIEDMEEPTYLVAGIKASAAADDLTWVANATLSASQLRVLSVQAGLKVPIELVQELLESFDDCHPAFPVGEYASTLARKLHAPPRSVLAFLRDAGLVVEGPLRPVFAAQETLF